MGGLIVRSYLAGKQTSGFSPPFSPKIRKAVFIGTPHFGAFAADFLLADIILAAGTQTNELKPSSQFIWDLGTWNQLGDDLRGVDTIALVGTAGPSGQSNGVVRSTSASLDFSMPGRTRVVNYCHVPPSTADNLAGPYLQCTAPGIAYVDSPAHPAYVAVSSFLMSGSGWQSVGVAPSQDSLLSQYGGIIVADVSSANQYLVPSSVSWGTVKLSQGAASELYYTDFVSGSATFNFGSSTCGPYAAVAGRYSTARCKFAPSIYSVGPLLPGSARVVQAGGNITISGVGFGATQCASCRVTAANPNAVNLQVLSWSDSTLTAQLPASFGIGIATIGVTATAGSDAMNIMAGTVVVTPAISLSLSRLNFAFAIGGAIPSTQTGFCNQQWWGKPFVFRSVECRMAQRLRVWRYDFRFCKSHGTIGKHLSRRYYCSRCRGVKQPADHRRLARGDGSRRARPYDKQHHQFWYGPSGANRPRRAFHHQRHESRTRNRHFIFGERWHR